MRCGKISTAARNLLVEMSPGYEKPGLFHLEVGIQVHDGEAAAFDFLLSVEGHRGGIVGRCIILGVVITVNTSLNVKHMGDDKGGIQIAVNREFGQWKHLLVAARLQG